MTPFLQLPRVHFDWGAVKALPEELGVLGVTRPLFVTDRTLVRLGLYERVKGALAKDASLALFAEIPENPTVAGVESALALYRAGDYERAGVPMLPVVAGARETKKQMLAYTILLWPLALAPALLGVAGALYGAVALALSALFTGAAVRVWRDSGERSARQMFAFSILYLFLLFAFLVIDRAPGLAGGLG